MIEIDIDAATPMLRRYSQWIGETLRRCAKLRSSGSPEASSAGSTGTRWQAASEMMRMVFLR
jgi:hypothetical protein